jgi:hypothetical protein
MPLNCTISVELHDSWYFCVGGAAAQSEVTLAGLVVAF